MEYFGQLNEFKANIKGRPPEKPGNLRAYELIQKMGIQIVEGGIMDQPSIWLLQYEAIAQIVAMFKHMEDRNNATGETQYAN